MTVFTGWFDFRFWLGIPGFLCVLAIDAIVSANVLLFSFWYTNCSLLVIACLPMVRICRSVRLIKLVIVVSCSNLVRLFGRCWFLA